MYSSEYVTERTVIYRLQVGRLRSWLQGYGHFFQRTRGLVPSTSMEAHNTPSVTPIPEGLMTSFLASSGTGQIPSVQAYMKTK